MTIHQYSLSVRTLGDFTITRDRKTVNVTWPDNAIKILFCSLLSPLDVSISRDRLCKALWNIPASAAGIGRLTSALGQLHDVMARTFGFSPIIVQDDGITLDYGKVYVDARDFHDTAISGFRNFAGGEIAAASHLFRTASMLYRGEFLPGMTGRIISATRNDLEDQYQMLRKQVTPMKKGPVVRRGMTSMQLCCTG
jgi:DNA-binding SARP family transcriptional activator